ncbi:hypothetical protein BJY01DRAFT_250091 [Aspergillus pseudoustus]|uniref:Xylanolytic transcriptional activator regulatory domain-containing protein n=1 Tax=Aspergillus pseudoustus TaxID=1810923 RepID=A0ABR4JKF4_9EURO
MRASPLQLKEKRTRQQGGSRPASSRGSLLRTSSETRGKRKLFTNSSSPTNTTGKRIRTECPKTFSFASTEDYFALKPCRIQDEPHPYPQSDQHLLAQQGAFTLPPDPVQTELMSTFFEFGHVWAPIIDPGWLNREKTPHLLFQSIFVAASRMASRPNEDGPASEFYRKAKLLFFLASEPDPLVCVVSAILLHWYNPVGAEAGPTDTSTFWLRAAETIAFQAMLHKQPAATDPQAGLRRRIWWTLVTRDCVHSAGIGRPRMINTSDSDVLLPSLDDFTEHDLQARTFPIYVSICRQLGDIVDKCLRRELYFEDQWSQAKSLFRWVKSELHTISGPSQSNSLETRQVLVTYFASLIMLDRAQAGGGVTGTGSSDGQGPQPSTLPSVRALLAASFIVGIYRDFLEKDELCRLGPPFTFFALCAGSVLIRACRFEAMWDAANEDTIILKACLRILARQCGSAAAVALRALQKLSEETVQQPPPLMATGDKPVPHITNETRSYFDGFNKRWCRLWGPIVDRTHEGGVSDINGSLRSILDTYAASRPWGDVPHPGQMDEGADTAMGMRIGMGSGLGGGGGRFDWGGSWLLDS